MFDTRVSTIQKYQVTQFLRQFSIFNSWNIASCIVIKYFHGKLKVLISSQNKLMTPSIVSRGAHMPREKSSIVIDCGNIEETISLHDWSQLLHHHILHWSTYNHSVGNQPCGVFCRWKPILRILILVKPTLRILTVSYTTLCMQFWWAKWTVLYFVCLIWRSGSLLRTESRDIHRYNYLDLCSLLTMG